MSSVTQTGNHTFYLFQRFIEIGVDLFTNFRCFSFNVFTILFKFVACFLQGTLDVRSISPCGSGENCKQKSDDQKKTSIHLERETLTVASAQMNLSRQWDRFLLNSNVNAKLMAVLIIYARRGSTLNGVTTQLFYHPSTFHDCN